MDEIAIEAIGESSVQAVASPIKRPRVWTVFATVVAGLILATAFQFVAIFAIIATDAVQGRAAEAIDDFMENRLGSPGIFMMLIACAQLGFAIATFLAASLSPTPMRERLGFVPVRGSWTIYPLVMLASWAVLAIGICLAASLTLIWPVDNGLDQFFRRFSPFQAVVFVLLISLPGIFEELLFRGYVQRRLLERWRPATAILVTSLLFAIVHVERHHVALAFPLGIWFGIVAWKTGSVIPCIWCHAFVNGSLNAWRMIAIFGDIPELAQLPIYFAAVVLGFVCLMISLNRLKKEEPPASPRIDLASIPQVDA